MIYFLGILFVSFIGTLGHFLYKFTNKDKLVGFFFSVNESLYEHLKLGFTPMLLWMIVENIKLINNDNLIAIKGISFLIFTLVIAIPYFITNKLLQMNNTFINLSSFYIAVLLAYVTTFLLNNAIYLPKLLIFLGIIFFTLVIASYFISKIKIKKSV